MFIMIAIIPILIQGNPYQNSSKLFCRNWQIRYKMYMELQRTWNNQSTFVKRKNKVGIFRLLNFKNYYKITIRVLYWWKDRHINQ